MILIHSALLNLLCWVPGSVTPVFAAVLLEARIAVSGFEVAHMCKHSALAIVAAACFPGSVTAAGAVVLETD